MLRGVPCFCSFELFGPSFRQAKIVYGSCPGGPMVALRMRPFSFAYAFPLFFYVLNACWTDQNCPETPLNSGHATRWIPALRHWICRLAMPHIALKRNTWGVRRLLAHDSCTSAWVSREQTATNKGYPHKRSLFFEGGNAQVAWESTFAAIHFEILNG